MPAVVLSFVMCVLIAYLSNEVNCVRLLNDGMLGTLIPCAKEGEPVSTSHISDSQCYHCICQNHIAVCTHEKCPSLNTCPLIEKSLSNVCCKRCKSCNYLGQTYQNNEQWSSGQDSCRTLTCKGGVVTQARMQCVTTCSHPQRLVGFCCPVCPISSEQHSLSRMIESSTKNNDPCVQCQCDTRWCHCFRTACPALDCQPAEQLTPAGSCCPECKFARESKTVADGCVFQNVTYLNEQSFRPDPCTLCKCQDNSVICRRFLCPLLNCPKNRLYYEKNLCCPRCRDRDPLPCKYENRNYKHGEGWELDSCSKCLCSNGETICTTIQCPFANGCPKGYQYAKDKKDQCCRTCEEIESTCTVFGDPHYQTFDGRMYNFQGTCRYVLAKNCGAKKLPNLADDLDFTIIVQNEPRGLEQYTWTRHVSLRLNGDKRITLLPGKRVRLNRRALKLPHLEIGLFSVTIHKENVVLRVVDGPKIVWDGNSYVEVTVPSKYRKSMCGLCGNYNGNPADDFQMSSSYNKDLTTSSDDETLMTKNNINAFGQSWRVGPIKACKSKKDQLYQKNLDLNKNNERKKAVQQLQRQQKKGKIINVDEENISPEIYAPIKKKTKSSPSIAELMIRPPIRPEIETSENDIGEKDVGGRRKRKRRRLFNRLCPSNKYEQRRTAVERCELLNSELFAPCHKIVGVRHYYKSCIMDACACPPSGRCYCESMLAYARKCEQKDIVIDDWRTKSNCVSDGESRCPMENGVFSLCTSSCGVRTCDNVDDICRNELCVPGCHCPNGTALYEKKCINVDKCPKRRRPPAM